MQMCVCISHTCTYTLCPECSYWLLCLPLDFVSFSHPGSKYHLHLYCGLLLTHISHLFLSILSRNSTLHAVFVCLGCHGEVLQKRCSNWRRVLSPSSGGEKSKIKVSAGLVPPKGMRSNMFQVSLLIFQWFSGAPWLIEAPCWSPPSSACAVLPVWTCVQICPFYKDVSHVGQGLSYSSIISVKGICCNDPVSK